VSSALEFYLTTLGVYLGVSLLACWALNLQFGVTGVLNFGFILFQALGAYTAAVVTLGPDSGNGGFQQYVLGFSLPFPLPLIAAAVVGAVAGAVLGIVCLRRLRSDYQAMVFLVITIIGTDVATNLTGLVNGSGGLSLVPEPLSAGLGLSALSYQWFYVGLMALYSLIAFVFIRRITSSPLGRQLRAVRDQEQAAEALGLNAFRLRLMVVIIGGAMAAVSGAALVEFIGSWGVGSWLYAETFVYLAAVIIGGAGNDFGVALGALVVPVAFNELPRFLPEFGRPGFVDAMRWVVIGLAILVFIYFRPQGIVPERPKRFGLSDTVKPRGRLMRRLTRATR
jgi:branched-chain amino acid transport system permease protein